MKSWMFSAVNDPAPIERMMRRSVKIRQWMGFKVDHAFEDAGLALGTTPRRVRGFVRGEVFKVAADEYRHMLHRWWADIDRQTAELQALAIRLQNEAEKEWSDEHQLSLPLGDPPSASSSHISRSGGRGSP